MSSAAGSNDPAADAKSVQQDQDTMAAAMPSSPAKITPEEKKEARLREEQREEPAGFLERMRARLLFSSNMHMRPVAVGAFALLIIIGGGTYAGLMTSHPAAPVKASATVEDLKSLDDNAQVFQQLNALDQNDQSDSGGSSNKL